jgi:subtilisin family serine protease
MRDNLPERRRPVIALFDTAISGHPWLDDIDLADPIWLDAEDYGCNLGPRAPAREGQRGPIASSTELESAFGHGTFSAGLIRQIAPDALIMLFRVMHDDGTIHGDHILNALGWIRDGHPSQISEEASLDQDPRPFVNVVCLPLGYTSESKDANYTRWLGEVLGDLGFCGVQVVASAGNDGTDEPVYPAAFALASKQPLTPLVSVGALNPNGRTRAHYSNHGDWVTDWAVGTSVVSSFPLIDGGAYAELSGEGRVSESVDPDDFTGGFSRWSGTSFAAAAFAGMFGQALLTTGALADPALNPNERAEIALRTCRQGA